MSKGGFIQGVWFGRWASKGGVYWFGGRGGAGRRGAGVKRGVYSSRLYPSISTARPAGVKLRGGQRGDSAICTSQPLIALRLLRGINSKTSKYFIFVHHNLTDSF